jgi:5'-nucleotidase
MGVDIYLSGTVAAVREAAFHGIPAIAISQYRRRDQPLDWVRSQHLTAQVLDLLLTRPPQATCFWNVNLPHLDPQAPEPELVFCDCSTDPLPLAYDLTENQFQYCGVYAQRIQTEGTDVAVCLGGGDCHQPNLSLDFRLLDSSRNWGGSVVKPHFHHN